MMTTSGVGRCTLANAPWRLANPTSIRNGDRDGGVIGINDVLGMLR